MAILIIAEHDGATLSEQTARALSAAGRIGSAIDILVAGQAAATAAAGAAGLSGVRKVLLAEHKLLAHQLAEPLAQLIVGLASGYDTILAPATTNGKNVMPRVAAMLDVMQVSEVMEVVSPTRFKRPIYAGNVIHTVQTTDAIQILTIRTASFPPAARGGDAPVEQISVAVDAGPTSFVEDILAKSSRPDLTSARIVVSGGRALGSREGFEGLILPLADRLSAAVGASRAAVDAGYAPNDWQVGQTGKVVAPDLYIAIGISGAIQHVAGMQDARVIVAINKDADAPIFGIANYGLVGDLFDIVPALERALR